MFKPSSSRIGLAALFFISAAGMLQAEIRVSFAEAIKAAVEKPTPEYSPIARQMKVTGRVEVEATVLPNGQVESVKVISGNPLLTQATVNAVKRWKFQPFTQNGEPTRALAQLSFEFRP